MTSPCRVFLTRHGEAAMPDEQGRILNYGDAPLTERGRRQARDLGRLLDDVPIDAVFCSDLARARQTAEEIVAGRDVPVVVEPLLREVDIGAFEGISMPELRGLDPRFIPWLEIAFAGRFPHARFCIPSDLSFPDGESVDVMFRRVKPAFLRIARAWQGRTVVVVSHAWLTQALISHVTGTGLPTYYRFAGANAVMTMAEVDPGGEGVLHVLNGNADLATVSGGRVRPVLEEMEQDWGAAARLGAGPERILGDLASTTRVWLIGHGQADEGRVRRVADWLTGFPIDAVHAADEPVSARAASEVVSGRDAGIHLEPGLLGVQDRLAATFLRIVEERLGGAVALVAPATIVQRLICHVLESDMGLGGRFPLVPGALTVAEVGADGRGILEMLNGRLSVGEVAGGRLLRTSTVP